MRRLCVLVASLVIGTFHLSTSAEDQIGSAIERLGQEVSKADRIAAAQWLGKSEDPATLQAVDALTAMCRDTDADIRNQAVIALGLLCDRHDRPCPLALIKSMFDSSDRVRTNASGLVSIFQKLPREAVSLLLKHAAHPDPQLRAHSLVSLGKACDNDEQSLAVLRQAVHDRDVMARTHAVAGLWHATNDLSQVAPHWLLFIEDARSEQRPDNRDAENLAAAGRNLAGIGAATLLEENGRKRPTELCDVLVELLGSDLPVMRRAAANQLAAMADDSDHLKRVLVKKKVAAALRHLLDDPDAEVRSAAAAALTRIE